MFISEVVAVSSDSEDPTARPLVCDFCGFEIEAIDQECPAREEGRCQP